MKQMSHTLSFSCGHAWISIMIILNNKKCLLQGLVMCAAALGDPDARTQFWTHVLDPPVTSFKQLMASETFTKQYQQEDMKKQVLYHIDNFIGKKCPFSMYFKNLFLHFFLLVHHREKFISNKDTVSGLHVMERSLFWYCSSSHCLYTCLYLFLIVYTPAFNCRVFN